MQNSEIDSFKKGFKMNSEVKDSLDIEISDELKGQVSSIKATPGLKIIIVVDGNLIIESIEFKKINRKEVLDWDNTIKKIMTKLKESRIESELLTRIHLVLSHNSSSFKEYVESITSQTYDKKGDDSKDKQKIKISKYYSDKERRLYESVVLESVPCFVTYDDNNDDLIIAEKIEEDTRVFVPYGIEDSPSMPYTFDNKENLVDTLRKSKTLPISDLYKESKRIISKYIDQKPNVLNIIAVDAIFSYFQDRFPTTHYLLFIGKNDVGKSAIGHIFEQLSYRGVMMTDPSVPNIYRLLGKIEPAQFTIILDEANDIDDDNDKMNVLKTGYTINGKVPKININNNNNQEFFKTYCFKVFLAETLPSTYKARGLLDRTFIITCLPGEPQFSIKDILVSQGKLGDRYRELREEIMRLRQSLFVYRLIHSNDERPDIDIGLKNRDRELLECITLFYDSDVQQEVEEAFQELLDTKYEQKENSFDAKLLNTILEFFDYYESHGEIFVESLWRDIKSTLNSEVINNNQIFLVDFNYTLYRNQLSNKCQIFGGRSKHTNNGNKIIFNDLNKLRNIYDSYSTVKRPIIRSSIRNFKGEGSEGSEGSTKCIAENPNVKITETTESLSTNN